MFWVEKLYVDENHLGVLLGFKGHVFFLHQKSLGGCESNTEEPQKVMTFWKHTQNNCNNFENKT